MKRKILANAISLALHPLTIPLYGMGVLFSIPIYNYLPTSSKLACYAIGILTLVALPLIALPIMRRLEWIQSYKMETSRDRLCPSLFAIICAVIGLMLTRLIDYTNLVAQIYLIVIIILAAFSIITYWWKISMHMTAIGVFCGVIFSWQTWASYLSVDFRPKFMLAIICAGLLGTARLYLGKHDFLQIIVGFLFGFILTLLLPLN